MIEIVGIQMINLKDHSQNLKQLDLRDKKEKAFKINMEIHEIMNSFIYWIVLYNTLPTFGLVVELSREQIRKEIYFHRSLHIGLDDILNRNSDIKGKDVEFSYEKCGLVLEERGGQCRKFKKYRTFSKVSHWHSMRRMLSHFMRVQIKFPEEYCSRLHSTKLFSLKNYFKDHPQG